MSIDRIGAFRADADGRLLLVAIDRPPVDALCLVAG